jgi:tRNA(Glu) U13 pseudouridine synthase TruD
MKLLMKVGSHVYRIYIRATNATNVIDKTKKEWKSGKRMAPRKVKILTEEDLPRYTMFDIVMPLPGMDVAYPGGELGGMCREFLRLDGLDPDDFKHKQKYELYRSQHVLLIVPPESTLWEGHIARLFIIQKHCPG